MSWLFSRALVASDMAKKIWTCVWLAAGLYFVVAALGYGSGMITATAMLCGFMVARNLADVVAT